MKLLILSLLVLAAAVIGVISRASLLADANAGAATVRLQLLAAKQAAGEIEQLSQLPPTAIAPGMKDAELVREIQDALAAAGIPSSAIRDMTIDARSEDRGGPANAGLSKRAGRMSLEGLTMPQLGAALAAMRERLPPLRIEQISIQKASSQEEPPLFRASIMFAAFAPIVPNQPAIPEASPPSPGSATAQNAGPSLVPSKTPADSKR